MPKRDLTDSPLVLGRLIAADVWTPIWDEVVNKTFTDWTLDRLSAIREKASPPATFYTETNLTQLAESLEAEQRAPMIGITAKGYELADAQFGSTKSLHRIATKQLFEPDPNDVELVAPFRADIENRLLKIASSQTRSYADVLDSIYERSLAEWDERIGMGETVNDFAKRLEFEIMLNVKEGLAQEASIVANRSKMIARSETIWSANEGAMQQYGSVGVTKLIWFATVDDVTCQYCVMVDGKVVAIGKPFSAADDVVQGAAGGTLTTRFDVKHPTLHPHCRCVILPVTSMGDIEEAQERGDELRADFEKRVESGEWEEDKKRRQKKLRDDQKRAREKAKEERT